jgi:hypothetical protein
MKLWTFFEFLTSSGRGVIADWYEDLAEEAQQDFDDLLRYLAVTPRHLWERPKFAPVSGYVGLGKLRFKANRIQYRPIGFFGPQQGEFTLLMGAEERGGRWVPVDAPDQALRRKATAQGDRKRIRVYDY